MTAIASTTTATSARPRVVIVDVHASDSFREFAAALRRRGVDVMHLRPAHSGRTRALKRAIDRLAGPIVPLHGPITSDDPAMVALRREMLSSPTVDLHAIEPVLADLATTAEWQTNASLAKLRPGIDLVDVLDKWEVGRLARAAGVAVPEASTDLTTDRFPVVVKGRLGAGGIWVRVVHDEEELRAAVSDLGGESSGLYLERYHHNETGLGTAGVARDGEVLVCGAFERLPSPDEPLAPAVAIRAFLHAQAIEASRKLIGALGYTGMFCLNFVPDDDGSPLLIDVNLRAFGAWVTLDELGVPVLDTYLDLIGAGPPAPPMTLDEERWAPVARIGAGVNGSWDAVWRVTRRTGSLVWRRRRTLGWGWMAGTEVRVAQSGVAGAADLLRGMRAR